jgi:hypothetical protein
MDRVALLTRRELIHTGLGGLALLALGRCARSTTSSRSFDDPGYNYRALSSGDRELVAAVGAAMLAGSLPVDAAAHSVAMVQVVRGVDIAIAGLPPDAQSEIGQLFGMLKFPVTRALTAGIWSSWQDASSNAVSDFLTRWRYSGVALFRTGYQALHQLVMASWYGNGASWQRIGYPGPPAL